MRFRLSPEGGWRDYATYWWNRLHHKQYPGCDCGRSCIGLRTHGRCRDCGRLTCNRELHVEPYSLRRHRPFVCRECAPAYWRMRVTGQAVSRRTRDDWASTALEFGPDGIRPVRPAPLPDQFPGKSRSTLKAFLASDASDAVVVDVGSASLASSIATLGLGEDVYVEQRSRFPVLRRLVRGKRQAAPIDAKVRQIA